MQEAMSLILLFLQEALLTPEVKSVLDESSPKVFSAYSLAKQDYKFSDLALSCQALVLKLQIHNI
jgi:hypothetical protein